MKSIVLSKYTNRELEKTLMLFCREFWFAPADVFLRTTETLIWSKQKFISPVLDIGCGDGRISKLLFMNQGVIDVGVDADSREILNAKASGVYRKLVAANAESMPFERNSFKTVVSNSTFEHIENDIQAVREVSRVLTDNGRFLLTVPTVRLKDSLLDVIKSKQKFEQFNKRVSHFHYRRISDWKRILEENKLRVEHWEYYFPKEAVRAWYRLFKLATFKPYRRELWSYLKDSPYGKLAPKKVIAFFISNYLIRFYEQMFVKNGNWVFIIAQKRK